MKRLSIIIGAAFLVACTLLFAQSPIVLDLSQMRGSPVAMETEPMTNALVLYPITLGSATVTNAPARSSSYADGVNDAMDAMKRVIGELPDGTNLTLEAACELVCEELHVERRK